MEKGIDARNVREAVEILKEQNLPVPLPFDEWTEYERLKEDVTKLSLELREMKKQLRNLGALLYGFKMISEEEAKDLGLKVWPNGPARMFGGELVMKLIEWAYEKGTFTRGEIFERYIELGGRTFGLFVALIKRWEGSGLIVYNNITKTFTYTSMGEESD